MTDNVLQLSDPEALLSYNAAVAVDMSFGCDASGAYVSKVPNAFHSYFKYSSTVYYQNRSSDSTSWKNQMRANLDLGEPLMYTGQGPDGGHAWVCDGYQGSNFFHFNWGWGGYENGYFSINNIDPAPYTFNSSQGAVFSITPDPSYYPTYCSGPTTLNKYYFGSIEDGSGPVADYQNNSNCSWLIDIYDSISSITLSFDKFDLDPSDQLNVYDGSDASAPMLDPIPVQPCLPTSLGPAEKCTSLLHPTAVIPDRFPSPIILFPWHLSAHRKPISQTNPVI